MTILQAGVKPVDAAHARPEEPPGHAPAPMVAAAEFVRSLAERDAAGSPGGFRAILTSDKDGTPRMLKGEALVDAAQALAPGGGFVTVHAFNAARMPTPETFSGSSWLVFRAPVGAAAKYPDAKAAIVALDPFFKTHGVSVQWLVRDGCSLTALVPLERHLPADRWIPLAQAAMGTAVAAGLEIDGSTTNVRAVLPLPRTGQVRYFKVKSQPAMIDALLEAFKPQLERQAESERARSEVFKAAGLLGEGGPEAVAARDAALSAMARESIPPEMREMNERFAVVLLGTRVMVADLRGPSITFMELSALRALYKGRTGPGGGASLADQWLSYPMRRQYEAVGFYPPPVNAPPGTLNLWRGFAVPPVPWADAARPTVGALLDGSAPVQGRFVTLWIELLKAGIPDAAVRHFVLSWLAWKVQNPGGVPGTILILIGSKGTGKNSLVEPLVRIFGAHGAVYDDPEQVAGRFTGHLWDKVLNVLDEALFSKDPRQNDRIKARTTATTCTFETKGMTPVQGVNRAGFILLTNHRHAWQATVDERRAAVVEYGDAMRGQHVFWGAYYKALEAGGLGELLGLLQAVDLGAFNPRVIPQSEALRTQQALTTLRNPVAAWWALVLEDGELRVDGRLIALNMDTTTEVHRDHLRDAFHQHAARSGHRLDWAPASREMRRFGLGDPVRRGKERTPMFVLPPLTTLRSTFAAATGSRIAGAESAPEMPLPLPR